VKVFSYSIVENKKKKFKINCNSFFFFPGILEKGTTLRVGLLWQVVPLHRELI